MPCVRKHRDPLKDTPSPLAAAQQECPMKLPPSLQQGLDIVSVFTRQVGRVEAGESCPVTVAPGDGIQARM